MAIVIALGALFFAQPGAAAPLGTGMFTGASSHETSGSVTVTEQGGQYVIELGDDFSLDGAPDPYVALGSQTKPIEGGLIAVLRSNTGAQRYAVDASPALDGATQVIIWCERYSVPLGVATIE
jgi:hypothetical protein